MLQHVSRFTVFRDRLLAIRISIGDKFAQIFASFSRRQQSSSFFFFFFNSVEVTLNGLCPIFHRTVFLSCENLPMFVRYSQKQFAKLCWPVTLAGLQNLITCAGHTTRLRQSCVYTLITNSAHPSQREFYTGHCINKYRRWYGYRQHRRASERLPIRGTKFLIGVTVKICVWVWDTA